MSSDGVVHDQAVALRGALTQWVLEPVGAPRLNGLTHWAAETMDRAGELCDALDIPNPFFEGGA